MAEVTKIKDAKKKSVVKSFAKRVDGWINNVTGLGIKLRDKRVSSEAVAEIITAHDAEQLYQTDPAAARIVDKLPDEMMREGYQIIVKDDDDAEMSKKARERLDELFFDSSVLDAMKDGRLYGGAALILGMQNQDSEKELELGGRLQYIAELDKTYLDVQSTDIQTDPTEPHWRKPEFYSFLSSDVKIEDENLKSKIHRSRMIIFDGNRLPYRKYQQNGYWHDSVLSRLKNPVRNYSSGQDSVATLIHDLSVGIFKLKGLHEIVTSNEQDVVSKRLEMAVLGVSIMNSLVLDAEMESYERKTTNVAGVSDLMKILGNRLVASTDMPHTVLLGESPTGSNATGNSTTTSWYDHVSAHQENVLEPVIRRVLDIIFSEKGGISRGVIPDYSIVFNPLWQMDEKEQAETRKTMSEADSNYIDRGVLTADEIAQSRFGGREYSIETTLDQDARDDIDEIEEEEDDDGNEPERP
ncbi:MAG: DUF1073 domain-containing protein [Deltaproteobacteria bacterium]|nr:DUF1073 domain-containing protein [Deltaproteobacteria bacterium]